MTDFVLSFKFTTKRFPGFSVIKILFSSIKDKLHGLFKPSNILISLISRGLRFFVVSYLSYKFGDLFTEFMEKQGSKYPSQN